MPIAMSALMMPGLGQFFQRRWSAGALLSTGFLVCFAGFLAVVGRILVAYYRFAFDFTGGCEPDVRLGSGLGFLAGALAVYLVSLADVVVAYRRAVRRHEDAQRAAIAPPPRVP